MIVLDKNKYSETKKARLFYCLISSFDSSVIAFFIVFLNELSNELNWSDIQLSIALALLPLCSACFIYLFSYFVSHHIKNLKLIRIIVSLIFILVLFLGFFSLCVKVNDSNNLLFYSLIIISVSLIYALFDSLLAIQSASIAYINKLEGTLYGHVCLYGCLIDVIFSLLAGFVASSLFNNYQGYSFLFLIFSPILIVIFLFTFKFDPYKEYIDEIDKKNARVKDIFKIKRYPFYFILVSVLIPFCLLNQSLTSNMFTSLRNAELNNIFNSLTWGVILSIQALVQFITIFINTKIDPFKKTETSLKVSLTFLFIRTLILTFISYFFIQSSNGDITAYLLILLASSTHGISNGLFVTSNMKILNNLMDSKHRTRAIFTQNGVFKLITGFFSFLYPLLVNKKHGSYRYIDFIVFLVIVFVALVSSFFFNLEDKSNKDKSSV